MRTLNTNVKHRKQNSKFSLPGFRSGSIVKKFFAILYYCYAVVSIIKWIASFIQGDFSGAGDVFGFIIVGLAIIAVFLTPVIAIGVSDYYDWHGIKLFLIIKVAICIFSTVAIFCTNLFSMQYIESVTGPSVTSDIDPAASSALDSSADDILDSSANSGVIIPDETDVTVSSAVE